MMSDNNQQQPYLYAPGTYHAGPALFPDSQLGVPQQQQGMQPQFQQQQQHQQQQPFAQLLNVQQQGQQLLAGATPLAQYFIGSGRNYVENNFSRLMPMDSLRYFFKVSNSYVVNKLKIVLFPFLHRGGWKRNMVQGVEGQMYLPPRDDINAPDLYIPIMALVTYVLAYALTKGARAEFTPDVLGVAATKGLVYLSLEIVALKACLYLMSASVPLVDLVAYTGYVFVGVVVATLAGLVLGPTPLLGVVVYVGGAMASFLVRTLRQSISEPLVGASGIESEFSGPGVVQQSNYRRYLLLFVGALQILITFLLS